MKRVLVAFVATGSLLACAGTEGVSGTSSPFEAPAPASQASTAARAEIERDLVLTLRRTTTEAFEIDRNPRFEVTLENTSTSKAHHVVLPSDGSESNWREPHVFFTVERRDSASSPWVAAPAERMLRCGMYAQDWQKDVVALEPGQKIVLPWFEFYRQWELDGASDVRVTARYEYGDHARDLRKVPPVLHATPAYAIASKPMVLAIDPAMSLELTWKGVLPMRNAPLAKSVEVVATNRSSVQIPIAGGDSGGNLIVEIEGTNPDGSTARHSVVSSVSVEDAKERLAPLAKRSVVGAAKSYDDVESTPGFRPKRVRAKLHVWWYTDEANGKSDERTARSPWVEIP